MSIRLRQVPGVGLVALCAARSVAKEGDVYLDDAAHMALARKFWQDYPACGIEAEPDVVAATERGEDNNPIRDAWERMYGAAVAVLT